jgi:MFS family permease
MCCNRSQPELFAKPGRYSVPGSRAGAKGGALFSMKRFHHFDWWLTGVCFSRTFTGLVFMTYAAALPILQKEWEMSATQGGSISSGFNIGYMLSLVACSGMADLVGPKFLYLGSTAAGALLSLVFALFARDYISGLVLFSLVGISMGGTYTTGLMILSERYPAQRRGTALGFFIASSSLGYTLSLILSGIAFPVGGYKLSFLITCLGPAVGFVLAWVSLKNTEVRVEKRQKQQKFVSEVLRNRQAMLLVGGYTFHSWELLGMWAWTPAFLASCLLLSGAEGLRAAGWGSYLNAGFHVTGLLASFSMGMLSDRLGRSRVIFVLSGVSTLCSFAFGWAIGGPLILVIGLGLIYAFSALGDSPALSAALTESVNTSYVGAAFGLRSLLGFGAGAISPFVFGAILDLTQGAVPGIQYQGWGWAYSILGLGGSGAVVMAYLFRRSPTVPGHP